MNEKQEEQMIKAAHKYWADESGSYGKEEIMIDSFVEGYKQAFALYNVVGQSEQLSLCQCDKPSPDIMYGKTCAECCLDINPKA